MEAIMHALSYLVASVMLTAGLSEKFGWAYAFCISAGLGLLLLATK